MPTFAWSRSRSSSFAIRRAARLRMLTTLCRTTSSTRTRLISSSSWARSSSSLGCCSPPCCCSSATDGSLRCVGLPGLLDGSPVDLLDRGALRKARVGPLGAVSLGQVHVQRQRLPGRLGPRHQLLEHGASWYYPPLAEVDHLAVHAMAD